MGEVGKKIGIDGYLEVTVEGTEHLDFSDFDRRSHTGVLLDGIGDALVLKQNREALQGRPKVCKGARSATMMYSYTSTHCAAGQSWRHSTSQPRTCQLFRQITGSLPKTMSSFWS